MTNQHNLSRLPFLVNDRPYCVWDWDLAERNCEFINSIDSRYFDFVGRSISPLVQGEDQHRAAVALRAAYSQGLETFFAILFAALQAPRCVAAWLTKYRQGDLDGLVSSVSNYREVKSLFEIEGSCWAGVASIIIPTTEESHQLKPLIEDGFGGMWARFAHDFLDPLQRIEYNSIKHGLRVRSAGFTLRMGKEEEFGKPAPEGAMHDLGGSEYGSTFYKPQPVANNKINFSIRKQSLNWVPENYRLGLEAISISLGNVLCFLKGANQTGTDEDTYFIPSDPDYYKSLWRRQPGVISFGIDHNVPESGISLATRDDILKAYERSTNHD